MYKHHTKKVTCILMYFVTNNIQINISLQDLFEKKNKKKIVQGCILEFYFSMLYFHWHPCYHLMWLLDTPVHVFFQNSGEISPIIPNVQVKLFFSSQAGKTLCLSTVTIISRYLTKWALLECLLFYYIITICWMYKSIYY